MCNFMHSVGVSSVDVPNLYSLFLMTTVGFAKLWILSIVSINILVSCKCAGVVPVRQTRKVDKSQQVRIRMASANLFTCTIENHSKYNARWNRYISTCYAPRKQSNQININCGRWVQPTVRPGKGPGERSGWSAWLQKQVCTTPALNK
jgi:hypothetical protein